MVDNKTTKRTNDTTEYETALVIDHNAKVFHISSNKRRMVNHLLRMAKEHNLALDWEPSEFTDYSISLTNVPVSLLTKLSIATNCK